MIHECSSTHKEWLLKPSSHNMSLKEELSAWFGLAEDGFITLQRQG